MTAKYRAVLADDHEVTRRGLAAILESLGTVDIIGEASDGLRAVELAEELRPDLLFADVEMPVLTGVDVAKRLSASGNPVRIIALSAYDYREYVYGLLRNGASAYLKKTEANRQNLAAAIETVMGEAGEEWISADLAKRLVRRHIGSDKSDEPLSTLTPREIELLRDVAYGKSNDDIAGALSLSRHTVKNHVDHIRSKLDLSTRAELVAWAWQHKVVQAK